MVKGYRIAPWTISLEPIDFGIDEKLIAKMGDQLQTPYKIYFMRKNLLRLAVIMILILGIFPTRAFADPVANTIISAKISSGVFTFEISHPETASCAVFVSTAGYNCQFPISYRVTSQNSSSSFYGNGVVLNESGAKVGFFGFTTFLDSPSPLWKSTTLYATLPADGKISLDFGPIAGYSYETLVKKSISVTVSKTAPITKLFDFTPAWGSNVIEQGVVYSKYDLGGATLGNGSTSMIIGFPRKLKPTGQCAEIVFHLAPVDFIKKEQPASSFYKKYAAFSLDVWTNGGLKIGSIDSRDSSSFFAPSVITQVPIKVCDSSINNGKDVVLKLEFKAGIANTSQYEVRDFSESVVIVNTQSPTPNVTKPTGTSSSPSISITCVKGKLTKKVTGVKPKCPTGFKKK